MIESTKRLPELGRRTSYWTQRAMQVRNTVLSVVNDLRRQHQCPPLVWKEFEGGGSSNNPDPDILEFNVILEPDDIDRHGYNYELAAVCKSITACYLDGVTAFDYDADPCDNNAHVADPLFLALMSKASKSIAWTCEVMYTDMLARVLVQVHPSLTQQQQSHLCRVPKPLGLLIETL